ncbi:MAG TPA: hypothetical protein VF920_16615 [Dongiaceae bacterium]
MNVTSIAAGSTSQAQSQNSQGSGVKGDLRQLIQAINSGDLSAAQTAFDSLSGKLQQSDKLSTTSSAGQNSNDPFRQFLQQIGAALDSNDIQAAQSALSSLETQAKGATHRHHHQGAGSTSDTASSTANSTSTTTSSSTISAATGVNLVV